MNKSMKWFLAAGVAAMMGAQGIGIVSADQAEQKGSNPTPHHFADKGDHKQDGKAFKEEQAKLLQFLKIDDATFKSDMKAGKTLLSIANEQGISEQELTDFLVAQMTQHIEDGVKDGRISADRADQMKAEASKRVSDMINGHMPMRGPGAMPGHAPFANPKLLELLKIDAATFEADMKAGKTLVTIADEQGVSEQTLKDFLVAEMTQRIDAEAASGKIPADRAEKIKAGIPARVSDMINGKMPMHGHGPKEHHPDSGNTAVDNS